MQVQKQLPIDSVLTFDNGLCMEFENLGTCVDFMVCQQPFRIPVSSNNMKTTVRIWRKSSFIHGDMYTVMHVCTTGM